MRRNGQKSRSAFVLLLVALIAAFFGGGVVAQTVTVMGPDGKPVQMTPEQMKAMRHGQAGGPQPGAPPGAQPGQEAMPEDKDKKKEGEEGKKKETDATVKRPEKPPRVPDPREFSVKLDDKGRVPPFNFIGQPWPDVMQWLATVSKCSLDWQELPNDYLNLTTQRSYPLDEVRDLINRHLNARGYISIQSGEVISVFKLDKVDPSLVRRVNEDQLYDLKPHDFVKVSFELPAAMEVDKAKDDVKQVLSPTAKVFPLVTSRRLLIMDSVANLRGVSELLNTERMIQDGRIVPKEFILKYARPQQVIEVLYMMVGSDPKGKPQQTDPNAQAQQMQMMQQMQQQGRAAEAAKMMQKGDAPKVYLAYNRHRNSVLVNAPPDQMKIIEQTIACLDVPFGENSAHPSGGTATDNQRVTKRYALTTLDPDKFVTTLEEIGGLSPFAEFKVDDNSKTLFAFATEADHMKIAALIRDFDGSGRHFDVIYLRKLPADAVAATIYKLMAGQNEKKDDNRRNYGWYDFYESRRDDKKKDTVQGFGVDADIENNRLLLWANDAEMDRVHELLVKLGEIPTAQQEARPVRLIEPSDGKSTAELLKDLRQAWSAAGGNELIIKLPPEAKPAPPDADKDKSDKEKAKKTAEPGHDRSASMNHPSRIAARFAELGAAAAEPANGAAKQSAPSGPTAPSTDKRASSTGTANPAEVKAPASNHLSTPAPITITVTPDGRLMLSSSDTAALDRLEQLIEQISPAQRRFKVYRLKYIRAFDMWYDLTDYFKEDLEAKEKKNDFSDWWFGYRPREKEEKSGPGLSKRRKLIITYDPPSNSILVANASASQTAEIEALIKEFDQPAPKDSVEKRTTKPIKVNYSRPSIIAAAIKEVYRDLLSSRDKEFDRGEQKDKKASAEHVTIIDYPGSGGGDSDSRPSAIKVHFDGALSLGADDVSGVLIVSAQQAIISDIEKMVHELDEQAAPKTTVQVYQTHGNVSAEALQKALKKSVGDAWLGQRPEQQPNQTGPDAEKKKAEGDRGRNHGKGQEGEKKE